MKKLKILAFWALSIGVQAQTLDNWVIGASGESKPGAGIELTWTLGETCISAISTHRGWITEGFHQPYIEIQAIELPNFGDSEIQLKVFPNPASDHIQINLKDGKARNFTHTLTDLKGKTISYASWEQASESTLNIRELPSGIYFLQVRILEVDITENQSFKIIKH